MKLMRLINKVILFIGVILILISFGLGIKNVLFIYNANTAEGTVINVISEMSDGSVTYWPEVQFKTKSGEVKTFVSSLGSAPPAYDIGDKVKVLYSYDSKLNAEINSFSSIWFGSLFMFFMGAAFIMFFIIGYFQLNGIKALKAREVLYFLKLRKMCPMCWGRLTRVKDNSGRKTDISKINTINDDTNSIDNILEKEFYYKCNECGKIFSLEQLAVKK